MWDSSGFVVIIVDVWGSLSRVLWLAYARFLEAMVAVAKVEDIVVAIAAGHLVL